MLLRRPFSTEMMRVAIGGREVGGGGSSVEKSKKGLASLLGMPALHNFHTAVEGAGASAQQVARTRHCARRIGAAPCGLREGPGGPLP